jgi:HD-GYP domain-containing protein (c-di-GMP phosphodiesterase class II)
MSTTDSEVIQAPPRLEPTDLWPALHRRLSKLTGGNVNGSDFSGPIAQIAHELSQSLQERPDDSLFVLVQMLHDLRHGYSTSHALLSALTCRLIAPLANIADQRLASLTQAALTMNIGMRELQDRLAHQTQPLDIDQRLQIERHPTEGASATPTGRHR